MHTNLYIYGKCSTCQNALKFLDKLHLKDKIQVKEITLETPSLKELERMLDYHQGNLKKLFNTSGQLYREMELTQKLPQMSLKEALTLLTQHGMLIKRPFLIGKEFGLTGFNETEWQKLSQYQI